MIELASLNATAVLASHIARGNTKLPAATAIFNLGAVTKSDGSFCCPSYLRGLCEVPQDRCYAAKAERVYRGVREYRERQGKLWRLMTAETFAEAFRVMNRRARRKCTALRFNEACDFFTQGDVDKAEEVARLLYADDITVYVYTARSDLDLSGCRHLVVNGSGRRFAGLEGIANTFTVVTRTELAERRKAADEVTVCPGRCGPCTWCLTRSGRDIVTLLH